MYKLLITSILLSVSFTIGEPNGKKEEFKLTPYKFKIPKKEAIYESVTNIKEDDHITYYDEGDHIIYHVEGIAFKSEEGKVFPLNKAEMSTLPETPYKALVRELNLFNNSEPGVDEILECYTKDSKKEFLKIWEQHEKRYRQYMNSMKGIKIICGFRYSVGILLMVQYIKPNGELDYPQPIHFVKEDDVWKKKAGSLLELKYPRVRLATYLFYCCRSYPISDLAEEIK